MTTTLTPPPSSPIVPEKLRHFAPIFPNIPIDIMTDDAYGTGDEPKAQLLKRVMSAGSNASMQSSKDSVSTPTPNILPLSPASTGARTPKAKRTGLKPEVDVFQADGKTTQLASDMDGLQVQSPVHPDETLPEGISQVMMNGTKTAVSSHDRSASSSTDSSTTSEQSHPEPPSHLGSSYGAEGFPISHTPSEYGQQPTPNATDLQLSAQAAAAVAAADEAIKQINGTSTVFQGLPTLPTIENPYTLPRGYANFVKPQALGDPRATPGFNIHRQSSLSSNTTEASTSSEESDLCIPSIEWVNIPSAVSPSSAGSMFNSPLLPGGALQQQQKTPGRMAPPALTGRGIGSPRRSSADRPGPPSHQQSLPLGATAHTPSGLNKASSALPGGVTPETPAEEDDDDATVGQGRERSPSTSSQSAQSGLDLLWRAANHNHQEAPNTQSPYDHAYDSKGKRKAGAEAVAQWRNSGIPIGEDGDVTLDQVEKAKPSGTGPPKKRRRSEIAMEEIDPALREADSMDTDEHVMDLDNLSDSLSADEPVGSEDDSEYQGQARRPRGRAGIRQRTGATGAAGGKKGGKAGGRVSTGSTANGTGSGSKGGSGKKAKKADGDSPGNGGGGGGGGGAPGPSRRISAGGPPGGVQCEYVNPLPPYNRCQDIFTRKYDLPRHMARHARREGELVFEGKLAEDKALLWKTIKDKPKVICNSCGESFTRMDALKRHQTKQHHS